jgi:hypothetical protein
MKSSWPVRTTRNFIRFLWNFFVGDTPELFLAVLVILGVVALLSRVGHDNGAALVVLPAACVVALGASLLRARRTPRRD